MARHRADGDGACRALDASQFRNLTQVDEVRGCREALLHRRKERVPPRDEFGVLDLGCEVRGLTDAGRTVVVEGVHEIVPPYSAAIRGAVFWAARHTACGVAGIAMSSCPNASVTAFMTAAGAAIAPASPQPFTPSGLEGQGVTVMPTSKDGRSIARGMQ